MSTTQSSHLARPRHRPPAIPQGRAAAPGNVEDVAGGGLTGRLRKVRAWMLVLPVDALLLVVPVTWNPEQWRATLSLAGLSILLLTGGAKYRARLQLSALDDIPSLITKVLAAAAIVASFIALRHDEDAAVTFLTNVAISLGLLIVGRMVTTKIIAIGRHRRVTDHPTVMVGGGPLAQELAQILSRDHSYGLSVVGYVDDAAPSGLCPGSASRRLGGLADLDDIVVRSGADVLLVADGTFSERELLDSVRTPGCLPCDLLIVPRMHYFHTQNAQCDHIGSIPVMRIKTPLLDGPARAVKRGFDIVVSSLVLLVIAPVLAVCALAVRVEGGPGVIFRQPRVGRDGIVFECLKFRSMRPADDRESATRWNVAGDNRVSPLGRFLRRTSLDELPQMWNILRGDMSLVGPRPERPHFVNQFSEEFDRYAHRHRVQAGLTGLAQVSGLRGDTSIADRARYDNYYIENWTLWLDIKIILRTFSEVLLARGR